MQPAVITFRPDNFLTVGFIVLIAYTAAVFLAQVGMRAGIIPSVSPAGASAVAPDQVLSN
jgi:hypothetical protein